MNIEDVFEWDSKTLEEMSLDELNDVQFILDSLPIGIDYSIEVNGKKYDYIEDYIEERTESFYDVADVDYANLVGKCFINKKYGEAIKIVGLSEEKPENFLFEKFIQHNDDSWHIQDYNWLQEEAKGTYNNPDLANYAKKYLKYCLTSETDMNINSENMFMLGKNGKLYSDSIEYEEMSPATFQLIRDEAIKNDGEYQIQDK